MGPLTVELVPGELVFCRLPPDAPWPPEPAGATFWSVTRTPDELSVACAPADAPAGSTVSAPYGLLRVAGAMDLSVTGVAAALTAPLAAARIPLMLIATYDTDWLAVPADRLDDALVALQRAGHAQLPTR